MATVYDEGLGSNWWVVLLAIFTAVAVVTIIATSDGKEASHQEPVEQGQVTEPAVSVPEQAQPEPKRVCHIEQRTVPGWTQFIYNGKMMIPIYHPPRTYDKEVCNVE